jgi:hypothetical protein
MNSVGPPFKLVVGNHSHQNLSSALRRRKTI